MGATESLTTRSERIALANLLGLAGAHGHSQTFLGLISDGATNSEANLEDETFYHDESNIGIGYSRQGDVAWTDKGQVSSEKKFVNTNAISFGPAEGGWSNIAGVALYDASGTEAGNKLWYHLFDSDVSVLDTETLTIASEAISATVDNDFSDFAEDAVLKDVLAEGGGFSHQGVDVGLHSSDPGESGMSNEISDSGYSRAAGVDFTAGVQNGGFEERENENDLVFGPFSSQQTISHVSIVDPTNNQLYSRGLTSSVTIAAGRTFILKAGHFVVSTG